MYLFDRLSLANPVSSHFTTTLLVKPGHNKVASSAWYLARFGDPNNFAALTNGINANSPTSVYRKVGLSGVYAAYRAMHCGPLPTYLHTITGHWGWSQVWSNVTNAVTWTKMAYSPWPILAARQLCGH